MVFPFIMVSPAYFASVIQLGGLMQTANAFGQVQERLSVFVNIYRSLAEWRAVIERLYGFDQSVAAARAVAVAPPVIEVEPGEAAAVTFKDLAVRLPNGVPLVNANDISIAPASGCWSTAPPAPANPRCSARSPASGRSAPARITVPKNAKRDDAAAAAVFSDRALGRRRRLSGRTRHLR